MKTFLLRTLGRVARTRAGAAISAQAEMAMMAGWSLFAALIARSANFIMMVICARVLSQDQFGEVAIMLSTAGMFGPIAGLGLSITTTKFLAEYRDKHPHRAGRILAMSLAAAIAAGGLMTIVLILLAPMLASWGLGEARLTGLLVESSGLLLLGVIDSVQTGALTGLEAFPRIAKLSAWNGVLGIPIVTILAKSYGATGAIAGLTLALASSCVLNAIILRNECRKCGIRLVFSGWAEERHILFRFSLPAYISGSVVAPIMWLANVLLVKSGGGLAQMALFTAADRFRFLLIFIPISASRIAVPTLSRLRSAGDAAGYRSALRWNVGFGLIATVPPALVCAALARPLMASFGEQFAAGWPVLVLLAISAIPTVLNTQLGAALMGDNRAWARTGTDALLAATFLLAAWWLVPARKASALALSFAIAYTCASITLWICLRSLPARQKPAATVKDALTTA